MNEISRVRTDFRRSTPSLVAVELLCYHDTHSQYGSCPETGTLGTSVPYICLPQTVRKIDDGLQ
jgi:hypothetical protein